MDAAALPGGPVSQGEQALWFLLLLLTAFALVYAWYSFRGRR